VQDLEAQRAAGELQSHQGPRHSHVLKKGRRDAYPPFKAYVRMEQAAILQECEKHGVTKANARDIARQGGIMWNKLSSDEQQRYKDEAKRSGAERAAAHRAAGGCAGTAVRHEGIYGI
jgi:hypothetical protein